MKYDKNNIFAKIIRGEIESDKVYEDENILAFHDISKSAPVHILVIPKGEFRNFSEFSQKESSEKVANFFKKIAEIAEEFDLIDSGYRIISNVGSDANQTVDHFHVHILGKKELGPLLSLNGLNS